MCAPPNTLVVRQEKQ